MKRIYLAFLVLFVGIHVNAQIKDVRVTCDFKGLKHGEAYIYESITKEKVATTNISEGKAVFTLKEDPKLCKKFFVYVPAVDDGKRNGVDSKYFFIDQENIHLSGRLRGKAIAKFKQNNSPVYENYKSAPKGLDKTALNKAAKELDVAENLTHNNKNAIDAKNSKSKMWRLRDKHEDAIYNCNVQMLNKLKANAPNPGLDACICEKFYGYRFSFIKPIVDKMIENYGMEYMKNNFWTNRLLTRYYIVSMYVKGRPMLDMTLFDTKDKMVKLSDFKGKFIYINVFDYDDWQSVGQLTPLSKLADKFKKKNIVFVNVCTSHDKGRWKHMIKEFGVENCVNLRIDSNYEKEVLKEYDKSFKYVYKTKTLPRAILVNPNLMINQFRMSTPKDKETAKILKALL